MIFKKPNLKRFFHTPNGGIPAIDLMLAFIVAVAVFVLLLWVGFFFGNEVKPSLQLLDQNKRFMQYIETHGCYRAITEGHHRVQYACDNGQWIEEDLVKVINSRYPN